MEWAAGPSKPPAYKAAETDANQSAFSSEKTASVHITNAMDKLGALSRYDAAASAARLGLLDSGGSDDAAGTDAGRHRGLGTGRSSRPGGGPRS